MRGFWRGCLIALVVYPISVVGATLVLMSPFLYDLVLTHSSPWLNLKPATAIFTIASLSIAVWCAVPALVMRQHLKSELHATARYVRAGMWTAIAAVVMPVAMPIVVTAYAQAIVAIFAPEANPRLDAFLSFAAVGVFLLALFAVAGAVGGFVFASLSRLADRATAPPSQNAGTGGAHLL